MRRVLSLLTLALLALIPFSLSFAVEQSGSDPISDFLDQRSVSLAGVKMETSFSLVRDINRGPSSTEKFCPAQTSVVEQTDDDVHPFQLPGDVTDGEEIEAWSHCTGRMDPQDQRSTPGTALNTPKDYLHHGFLNLELSSNEGEWTWERERQRCGDLSDEMKAEIAGKDVHHAIGKLCEEAPSCDDMKKELGENYRDARNNLPESEKERIPTWETFKNIFKTTQFDTERIHPQKLPPNMLLASMYVLSKGNFLEESNGLHGAFMIPSHDDEFFKMDPYYEDIPTVVGKEENNPGSFTTRKRNIDSSLYSPAVNSMKFVQRLQRGWREVQKRYRSQFEELSDNDKWHLSLFSALHRGNVGREYFKNIETFNKTTQCNSCETLYDSNDCSDIKRNCSNPGENSCGEPVEYSAMNFERMLGLVHYGRSENEDSKMHCLGKRMLSSTGHASVCDLALMHTQVRNIMRLSQCE